MTPKMKICTARYLAMSMAPYFSALLYKLQFQEVALGTISEDGTLQMTPHGLVRYESAAVERWTERQLGAVIVHELMHLVRDHTKRCGTRDHYKWNLAGDAEINDDLQAMRLPLPGVPIVPETYGCQRGLTAEEYYAVIDEKEDDNQGGDSPSGGQGPGHGKCGGCSGNTGNGEPESEEGADAPSDVEMEAAKDQVAEAVQQEAKKGRGTVPAGLARWADVRKQPPRIPWEARLARACRRALDVRAGSVDFRFGRMSRRQAGVGYGPGKPVLPGLVAPIPNVGIGFDTSGSMGAKELETAITESEGILRAVGAEVSIVVCDAQVHAVGKLESSKDITKHLKGGGGTDFRPLFDQVSKLTPKPEVFVFITDGCGPSPDHAPPGVHVIWLLVGPYKQHPGVSWGQVIEMND